MPQLVTFSTVSARTVSRTARGDGQVLNYKMIVGIEVGKQSVRFRHPEYASQVAAGAKESQERIMMPTLMAARLIPFANACLVKPNVDYDGTGFVGYVSGFQATPRHRSHGSLRLRTTGTRTVEEMAYHVIGDERGKVLQSFIGLRGGYALCVFGLRDVLGISTVKDLMRVYGAVTLGKVTSPV